LLGRSWGPSHSQRFTPARTTQLTKPNSRPFQSRASAYHGAVAAGQRPRSKRKPLGGPRRQPEHLFPAGPRAQADARAASPPSGGRAGPTQPFELAHVAGEIMESAGGGSTPPLPPPPTRPAHFRLYQPQQITPATRQVCGRTRSGGTRIRVQQRSKAGQGRFRLVKNKAAAKLRGVPSLVPGACQSPLRPAATGRQQGGIEPRSSLLIMQAAVRVIEAGHRRIAALELAEHLPTLLRSRAPSSLQPISLAAGGRSRSGDQGGRIGPLQARAHSPANQHRSAAARVASRWRTRILSLDGVRLAATIPAAPGPTGREPGGL